VTAPEDCYTVAEAAKLCGCTESLIRDAIYNRRLPSRKIGSARLIDPDDLAAFASVPHLGRRGPGLTAAYGLPLPATVTLQTSVPGPDGTLHLDVSLRLVDVGGFVRAESFTVTVPPWAGGLHATDLRRVKLAGLVAEAVTKLREAK
jgi:excisionase family DNA binding protein